MGDKKRICIIYTGGTIGMIPSEQGYVPQSGVFEPLLRSINDIHRPEFPDWELVEFSPPAGLVQYRRPGLE